MYFKTASISPLLLTIALSFSAQAQKLTKIYENAYDGEIRGNTQNVSFLLKGKDVVAVDWNSKKESIFNCDISDPENLSIRKISKNNEFYLLYSYSKFGRDRDGWVLDRGGSCFRISEIVPHFSPLTNKEMAEASVYFSEKLNQLIVNSVNPDQIIFIDVKTKKVKNTLSQTFKPGLNSVTVGEKVYSYKLYARGPINVFDLKTFSSLGQVNFGRSFYSFFVKESNDLGLQDALLFSASAADGTDYIGRLSKTDEKVTPLFKTPCGGSVLIQPAFNSATCHSTPAGFNWPYFIQDLKTGDVSTIWSNLFHEPIVGEKSGVIVANLQNGVYEIFDIKTKSLKSSVNAAIADQIFFDKEDKNIIAVTGVWNGTLEIYKFPVSKPTNSVLLYSLKIAGYQNLVRTYFNQEQNKLYISTSDKGAYYLDIP